MTTEKAMDNKLNRANREPIPEEFGSLEEASAFWDTHDTADYEDLMEDVSFTMNFDADAHKPLVARENWFFWISRG